MSLDWGRMILALLISVVVIGTVEGSLHFQFEMPPGFPWSNDSSGKETGHKIVLNPTNIPISTQTDKIMIENSNGGVILQAGNVSQMEIKPTVWVDTPNVEEAEAIANQTKIDYDEGTTMKIATNGKTFSGSLGEKRLPRINLVITLPATGPKVNLELLLKNGDANAKDLPVRNELKAHTTNGAIIVSDLNGSVILDTTNGTIQVSGIKGNAQLHTTNGLISSTNVDGDVTMDTTNGPISIHEAIGKVKAETTNGMLEVTSHTIGGNWQLETTVGEIHVAIPSNGNYEVVGSGRRNRIQTDLPLMINRDHIQGKIGSGQYEIKIETNSGIQVNKID